MGSLYKRGQAWYIDTRVDGRRVRKRIGPSKQDAPLVLKDVEVKAARKEFGFFREDVTIDVFLQEFAAYSKTNHRPSTAKRYRAVVDHWRDFLSHHPSIVYVSHVAPATIEKYKTYRRELLVNPNGRKIEGKSGVFARTRQGAQAHTINFEVGALRSMFFLAIKWGYLKDNPTKGIKKLKIEKTRQPRYLSADEMDRLLAASPPFLRDIFFTFLHTGMRKAELENLEWADVDLKRRRLSIRAKDYWQPKTGERVIPISDKLHEVLSARKADSFRTKSRWVFSDPDGVRLSVKLRDALIRTASDAGIADLTKIHTLRHTFASNLVMKGVDLPTVQKLMGHADIETTMIYAHLAEGHLAQAVNKL